MHLIRATYFINMGVRLKTKLITFKGLHRYLEMAKERTNKQINKQKQKQTSVLTALLSVLSHEKLEIWRCQIRHLHNKRKEKENTRNEKKKKESKKRKEC